jgi:hypothetical protein
MIDLTQFLTDPNVQQAVCAQWAAFDPTKFAGMSSAPFIERAVQYLRDQWNLSVTFAPLVAVGLGMVINVLIAGSVGLGFVQALGIGALTGLLASGWHVVAK